MTSPLRVLRKRRFQFMLTPLVDVMFLLLIFFMLSSQTAPYSLLQILAGREYQYTVGRDAGVRQPRPQNFYGPMVVMQNERSASDAEMFPAGFRALGLGKVVGVPTMGAVIGTGSYTLLDGSAIRTPGTGVWITNGGQNMENFGVPPDVRVDNSPDSHAKGRDMQIEKAVEILKQEMAAGVKK